MTQAEFIDVVTQMRTAQKTYFKTRSKTILEQSKALERSVDAAIAKFQEVENLG
jgi:hypothetical protein